MAICDFYRYLYIIVARILLSPGSIRRLATPVSGAAGNHYYDYGHYYYYSLNVSGGSPVHLRSKHHELVGKTLWVKQNKEHIIIIIIIVCIIK